MAAWIASSENEAMTPLQQRGLATLTRRYTLVHGLLWAIFALAAPTALKFTFDSWFTGVPPFLTYFPAITLAALLLGWRWGMIVLIASAAACDYLFMAPVSSLSLATNNLVVILLFVAGGTIIVVTAGALRGSAMRLQTASEREHELNAELKHRVNNTLAIMQALASQTARSRPAPQDFYETFSQRLDALREAHDVLSSTDWISCDLPRLAKRGLKGFLPNPAISIVGLPCTLPSASCVPLTLALHELGTNAANHGALASPGGRIALSWVVEETGLVLRWIEEGGPPVVEPSRKGLGTRLLAAQHGLDEVAIDYAPGGVRCTIVIKDVRPAATAPNLTRLARPAGKA
jgi:two-component sensor histidine kinase